MGELLNVSEAAEYLRVPKSRVYSLVEAREIPFYKVGRLIRFRKAEIDSWLSRHKFEPFVEERVKKILAGIRGVAYNPGIGRPEDLGKEASDG